MKANLTYLVALMFLIASCKKETVFKCEEQEQNYFAEHHEVVLYSKPLTSEAIAYDLVEDTPIDATDDYEMYDLVSADSLDTEYNARYRVGNLCATTFVKTDLNFYVANKLTVITAYEEGVPVDGIEEPAIGDVYIAKLRGSDTYAVIKIDDISDPFTCGQYCSAPALYFSYLK